MSVKKKIHKLVKAKRYYMRYISYIKMLLEKICRLLGSLSSIQKQGAVSAPKIAIFPNTIFIGSISMISMISIMSVIQSICRQGRELNHSAGVGVSVSTWV